MKFFDMDGTITESKQKISPEMKSCLSKLDDFIVISGASREQILKQMDGVKCTIMAQSGNDTPLWFNKLSTGELHEIMNHIMKFSDTITDFSKIEDRGGQLAYSFLGHDAPIDKKKLFDPTQKIRQRILARYPFKSKTLVVKIAGTTCFDYTKKYGTKGHNIKRWIKENSLDKRDCIFYGDKLYKGGNDETVVGVIKTVQVENPEDLMKKL